MNTNGSLCFNTAAGCISRHQLVQFHNRMGPRAQRAVRYTVWQRKCHNSSFLTVQRFIRGAAVCSSMQQKKTRESSSSENSVRLLNGALFTPDSSMREISSPKPKLLRSRTDAAPSKTLKSGLFQNGRGRSASSHGRRHGRSVCSSVS